MKRVLFLSSRNAARAVMAEAWLKHFGADAYAAESAGTQPAEALHPLAVDVMREAGIDLDRVRPRSAAGLRREDYDLVIIISPREGDEAIDLPGARETAHWTFDDPSSVSDESEDGARRRFLRLRDELRTRVTLFVNATTDNTPPASIDASLSESESH
jgi:arsenate reductase (thioredoxin)